ncbi:Hypothetical protein CINCED_3A002730 [Cinara cedri]|uniref:CN hydrolase domain-containing protein n=1 Tax=Cinara cedri TaxID=506608 RepID=A0A5E4MU50_9HEMI|nr:Hypothetical protein CINCED_3A002730 [Cinara cedri]
MIVYISCYITIMILIFVMLLMSVLNLMVSGNDTTKNKEYDNPKYIAAAVEYHPNLGPHPLQSIENNLPIYEDIIHNASQYDVDILVFPEAGLSGVILPQDRKEIRKFLMEIPSPESNTIPCFNEYCSTVLSKLSCAARLHHMYVVVNLPEIEYCNKEDSAQCSEDSANYYNTNVVFDREGRIIARYRKFNLFIELGFNHTKLSELCTFDTDFGVRFGMFICFDILFQDPAARLVQESGVKDVIFSAAWFSEVPLLAADSVQAGWAYANDVNLIAAGYNDPKMCGGGSGIYAGKDGPLVMYMPDRAGTHIILSRVPKRRYHNNNGGQSYNKRSISSTYLTFMSDYLVLPYGKEKNLPNSNRPSDLRFFADNSFKYFNVAAMRSADPDTSQDETLTATFEYKRDGFECAMTVSWLNENNNDTTCYDMFAYTGTKRFGILNMHIETCGLTAYKQSGPGGGAIVHYDPPKDMVTITAIAIRARSTNLDTLPIPSTLDARNYPLASDHYTFGHRTVNVAAGKRKMLQIDMVLSKPVANLVTFGIYKLPQPLKG